MKYVGTILPSGNQSSLPNYIGYCFQYGIRLQIKLKPNGGFIVRLPVADKKKLPKDTKGHHLLGQSIWPIDEKTWKRGF